MSQRKKSAQFVKFSPDAPEARDEGPRLIPLDDSTNIPLLPDHFRYLALADEALGIKPKHPRKPK